jgi:hypothetical protein
MTPDSQLQQRRKWAESTPTQVGTRTTGILAETAVLLRRGVVLGAGPQAAQSRWQFSARVQYHASFDGLASSPRKWLGIEASASLSPRKGCEMVGRL